MYIRSIFTLIFLYFILCNPSHAQLKLVSSINESSDIAYGKITLADDSNYWIIGGVENNSAIVKVSNFNKDVLNNESKLYLPYFPIVLGSTAKGKNESQLPIFGLNEFGVWQVSIANLKNSKINKNIPLPDFSLINDVEFHNGNYYVAGISSTGMPLVQILNGETSSLKGLNLKFEQSGEVTNVFMTKNGVLAITNYSNATSDLRSIQLDGSTILLKSFASGATTGLSLKEGGIAITYRFENKIFVEKLDDKFQSVWRTPLYSIQGPSTKKNLLIKLPAGLGFVGGVNSHLKVIRLNELGQIINESTDDEYEFLVPPIGLYSATAEGNLIHIRGQARRAKNSASDGRITTFHFVDKF